MKKKQCVLSEILLIHKKKLVTKNNFKIVTQISPHVKTHAFVTLRSFFFTSTFFPVYWYIIMLNILKKNPSVSWFACPFYQLDFEVQKYLWGTQCYRALNTVLGNHLCLRVSQQLHHTPAHLISPVLHQLCQMVVTLVAAPTTPGATKLPFDSLIIYVNI